MGKATMFLTPYAYERLMPLACARQMFEGADMVHEVAEVMRARIAFVIRKISMGSLL